MFTKLCLTTGPLPLPKRVHHRERSSAYSINFQRSSNSCLRLRHTDVTSNLPSLFPSISCFTRQFLNKMWPIQLDFLFFFFFFLVYRMGRYYWIEIIFKKHLKTDTFGECLLPFSSALTSYTLPITVQIKISRKNSLSLSSLLCGCGKQYLPS